MHRVTAPLLTTFLALAAGGASAQLYKWVDASGGVNYGDWPPAGVRFEPVTHGTVSVVGGVRQAQAEWAREIETPRRATEARRPVGADTTRSQSVPAQPSASSTGDDIAYVDGYAPYDPYLARRAVAADADAGRRRNGQPVAKAMLPVDLPSIPDMPLRPRPEQSVAVPRVAAEPASLPDMPLRPRR
jgi:hypothetical protein